MSDNKQSFVVSNNERFYRLEQVVWLGEDIRFGRKRPSLFRAIYEFDFAYNFFFAVIALVFLFVYSQIGSRRRRVEQPFSYKSRQRLFTPTEAAFLYALEKAVGNDYRIFGKVRLADIVDTEIYRGVGDKAFSLIAFKHIDFLLCDKSSSSIVCAVELDDWTHGSEKRRIKDAEKTYALNSAAIPLVRFSVHSSYALREIKVKILDRIGKPVFAQPSRDLSCPKCGADVVARVAKSGVHRGSLFVGCSGYPDCRFIAE